MKGPGFLLTTQGDTVAQVLDNLRNLFNDYLLHEGKHHPDWQNAKAEAVGFACEYELAAFFEHFKELKISAIAA